MKNNKLTKVVLIASILSSSAVFAESDYPATDFQPKVVYSDTDYKHSSDAGSSASSGKQTDKSVGADDSNYPATNYQPKVLYSDAEYKHSSAAPSAARSGPATKSAPTSASSSVEVIQTEKAASSDFSYIGLILLAVAGFFVYNKKAGTSSSKTSSTVHNSISADYTASADGATGVEKYLEKLVDANKTGVAKYLEKQTSTPSTGVAKYMAKQIVKDREAAAGKATTGVEKYLRDNG